MTACRNKARGAVVAALAGALTLGAAPVMALADGASLMATDDANIAKGTVQYSAGKPGDTFAFNDERQGIVPSTLTPVAGDPIDLSILPDRSEREVGEYYYFYFNVSAGSTKIDGVQYKNASGKLTDLEGSYVDEGGKHVMPTEPGTYAVVVFQYTGSDKASWNYVEVADTFTITGRSLADATLYEIKDDEADLSDTTFDYTGVPDCRKPSVVEASMGVAVDGVALEKGTDYSLDIYEVGASSPMADTERLVPGTQYVAKITGIDDYAAGPVEKTFTYQALDLESADVETITTKTMPTNGSTLAQIVSKINGIDLAEATNLVENGEITVSFVSAPDGSLTPDDAKTGEYTFRLDAKKAAEGQPQLVTGSTEVKVLYVDQIAVIDFSGCNDSVTGNSSASVDLSEEKPDYFDLSKISVKDEGGDDVEDYDVAVLDEDGKEVSEDSLEQPGTWTVRVTVNTKNDDGELVANVATCKVVVSYENVSQAANVFLTFDGKNVVSTATPTYDGTDLLPKVAVKVVAGEKTLAEGTDYEVVVENAEGDEVDQIVDAGKYTVTVKGLTYSGNAPFTIDVQKLGLESAKLAAPFAVEKDASGKVTNSYVGYTGEELAPEYVFVDEDGNEWTLGADEYDVSYSKGNSAADLKDEGEYNVTVSVSGASKNFKNAAGTSVTFDGTITVTANRVFADVPNDEYYTEAVSIAKQQGYVEGMGGSNLFMPNRSISRADMVVVLYRMAGGSLDGMQDGMTNEEVSYVTGFGDADKNAYYAKALAWAAKAGIVTGYEDGNFGPADDVTVEQFVTMLARYAEVVGNYEAVDADEVLSGVADGDQVSEFGQDAVAWAVENGYLAQGGADIQPQSPVTRGRAVTIAVRYQPEKADLIIK